MASDDTTTVLDEANAAAIRVMLGKLGGPRRDGGV